MSGYYNRSLEILARIARETQWGELEDCELDRRILGLSEEEFGHRMTRFLMNGMQVFVKVPRVLRIDRAEPFNPVTFDNTTDTTDIWRGPKDGRGLEGAEEQDVRSLTLEKVDFAQVIFTNGPKLIPGHGNCIEGKRTRLAGAGYILLDAKVGQALYEEAGQATLEWIYNAHGISAFDLPGTTLRRPDGYPGQEPLYQYREILYLRREGDGDSGKWKPHYIGISCNAIGTSGPSAVLPGD